MSFMERQIEHGQWIEVDGPAGIEIFPADMFTEDEAKGNYSYGEPWSVETVTGYGARLSAPGYLDCTEWTVFETEAEAEEFLRETYGDDDE